ncbi:MAG TPA: hypothetical protein VFB66_10310 [Tepidisphaeraceae bacterium]|jgi:hypothetical protein|nr:hypothetical protein [Tepidisphaeraceae bacterium]
MTTRPVNVRVLLSLVILALVGGGCRSIGPRTVASDRVDYSRAIADSWKRQTLLNIVKLRYFDPPIFVDVGSVVSGYSLETGLSVTGTALPYANGDSIGVQGSGRFTDRPTITYIPLTGNRFVAGLMMPITPESLLFTIQSGWPADVMLRLGAGSINGLRNESVRAAGVREADPRFERVAQLMRAVQDSGAMSVRVVPGQSGGRGTMIVLRRENVPPEVARQVTELGGLLGLEPGRGEYRVAYGSLNVDGGEIAILTRSLFHVIGTMASRAELPPRDVAQGRASLPLPPAATAAGPRAPFIRCSPKRPPAGAAFASVSYRGHWFWIDDRDLLAKREFAFVMLLFTLADTGPERDRPVITIPAQ